MKRLLARKAGAPLDCCNGWSSQQLLQAVMTHRDKNISQEHFFLVMVGSWGGEESRVKKKSGGHGVQFDTHRARANKDEGDFNEPA